MTLVMDRNRMIQLGLLLLVWSFLQRTPRGVPLGTAALELALQVAVFVVAICLHEFAHAFVATRLGDPTPRMTGRLTLDPRAHLDPLGTLLILVVNFGFAKPVLTNPAYFRRPARDSILVALAGPAMNLVLCAGSIMAVRQLFPDLMMATTSWWPLWKQALKFLLLSSAVLNAVLAIFNLLPIPPLDGSHLLERALSGRQLLAYRQNQMLISIVGLVLLMAGLLSPLFAAVERQVLVLCAT